MAGTRHRVLLCTVLLACALPRGTSAQTVNLNYAFASQLGSGIYRVGDQTVQMYRLVLSRQLRPTEQGRTGLMLRAPLAFGFYNFELGDILDGIIPDNVATLSLVPMLEFEVAARHNWWLIPYGAFGAGYDFSVDTFNPIFTVGLRSLFHFDSRGGTWRLGNRLFYSGYTDDSLDLRDDFSMLETGLEWRRGTGWRPGGSELDAAPFVASYVYLISPRLFDVNATQPLELRTEWELGVTLGMVERWHILGIGLPRLGLSYRFGSGADAVRIVFGNAFTMDSPFERGAGIN